MSFSRSKPGFVPLLKTLYTCYEYKIYSNEEQLYRIRWWIQQNCKCFEQNQRYGIYGDCYKKLSIDYFNEIQNIYQNHTFVKYPFSCSAMKIQICIRTAFVAAFIDDFWKPAFYWRRNM
jgi:hypothetical protein